MSKKVVTLGEIMLRLSTPDYKRFVQAENFNITFGGGEANVSAALCNYGIESSFVSKVPDNPIGQAAINHLRRFGVDTQFMVRGGNRLGIYFVEPGAAMRPTQVVYDRAGSSITEADVAEFDFDKIFDGADWFHTSGITPAISDKALALTEAALQAAKEKGLTISIDVNYRKKLWSSEKAREVMTRLCAYADICIGAETTLGFKSLDNKHIDGKLDLSEYQTAFEQMTEKFGFKYIATILRESPSASDNSMSALVYGSGQMYKTKEYTIRIVDRVGTGDSFASGFIYGLITGMAMSDAAEFGAAAAALKHTIPGDFNHVTINEVGALVGGDGSGKVQR